MGESSRIRDKQTALSRRMARLLNYWSASSSGAGGPLVSIRYRQYPANKVTQDMLKVMKRMAKGSIVFSFS